MKASTLVVAASLTVNVVLLWALGSHLGAGSTDEASASPKTAGAVAPTSARSNDSKPGAIWAELQDADLPAQVDRLRAKGFPPEMIRAIMTAQIRSQFASRRKAIEAAAPELPFWDNTRDAKTELALRALSREEQKALRDLLGPDPENSMASMLRRTYPNLSSDKIDEMARIRERANEKRNELILGNGGRPTDDYQQKSADIDKAMHAELASVLTPQELEDFDLHESRTASQLRYNLESFAATEAEYRALYKLQSAYDEQFGPVGPGASTELMRARAEGRRVLDEQIKTALGAERFAEYQRSTDYSYRQTTQLVARLNLPPETANELYSVQQDAQRRVAALRQAGPTTPAERNAQMAAIAAEAESTIVGKLGAEGFAEYKRYGGNWLTNLIPRPPPTPKR